MDKEDVVYTYTVQLYSVIKQNETLSFAPTWMDLEWIMLSKIIQRKTNTTWSHLFVEYENKTFQHLGSVVTNHGYSDWATTAISADVKTMWYRFSRREDDYCIECSADGVSFTQMRVCHMWEGAGTIRFGIYACSPEDSSFTAVFTNMNITECAWKAHDGQQPDW